MIAFGRVIERGNFGERVAACHSGCHQMRRDDNSRGRRAARLLDWTADSFRSDEAALK